MAISQPGTKGFVREHGASRSRPEYGVWKQMRKRCNNPNYAGYKNYGGRGIKVCPEWQTSFPTFFRDMGPRPTPKHTIERKNNDEGYSPENCRWATRAEQALNMRTNRLVGPGQVPAAAAMRQAGLYKTAVTARAKLGWAPDRLLQPVQKGRRSDNVMLTFRGKTQTQTEWAREIGLSKETLYKRIKKGWPLERALTS